MIGDKRETFVLITAGAAYTLANEIKADYNLHIASTTYHKAADTTNAVASSDATTLATLYTLANEIKADYNAHEISTTYHNKAGANPITSPDATSATTAYELLNEIKDDYNTHVGSAVYHKAADATNVTTSPHSKVASVNKDFNADGGSVLVELTGADSWDGTVDFQTTPDGVTFYNIPYINRASLSPVPSVAQISSPSTATLYLLLGPLSQVRIVGGAGTVGSLTVVYRTIQGSSLYQLRKRTPVHTKTTGTGTAVATLTPGVAFKMIEIRFHLGSALAAAETLTVTQNAAGTAYDTLLLSEDMGTSGAVDLVRTFDKDEGFFESTDSIVIALSANAGPDTWGCQTIHELI